MVSSSSNNEDLIEILRNLENLRLEFQILYYPEEDSIGTKVFDNAENALDFYLSAAEHQNPISKCLISASHENIYYLCLAPITLKSLTEIIDTNNQIPPRIKETALQAIGTRILKDLPFNSCAHGYII